MYGNEDLQLMLQIARLYYEQGLNQEQIAKKLDITRQKVSRLLVEARSEGFVRIIINDPKPIDSKLCHELKKEFNLHEIILIEGDGLEAAMLRSTIGIAAARYLLDTITDESQVGIGWGRTLYDVVSAFQHNRQTRINVVPLIGGIGDMAPFFQVNEIARRTAEMLGGSYRFFHVPAFVQDDDTRDTLMKMQEVETISGLWSQLDMAIIGIGHVELQKISSMFCAEYIQPSVLNQLQEEGAVGDICGRFFDVHGKSVVVGTEVIGIDLKQLRSIPEVIGIGGGLEKVRAILGALRGGYIKTLISDTVTARSVLSVVKEGGG